MVEPISLLSTAGYVRKLPPATPHLVRRAGRGCSAGGSVSVYGDEFVRVSGDEGLVCTILPLAMFSRLGWLAPPSRRGMIPVCGLSYRLRMKTSAGSLNRELNLRTCSSVRFRCPERNIETATQNCTYNCIDIVNGVAIGLDSILLVVHTFYEE